MVSGALAEVVERSADPAAAGRFLGSLVERDPHTYELLEGDQRLRATLVAIGAASPFLSQICVTDPRALDVLADIDTRPDAEWPGPDEGRRHAETAVARFKQREMLRIAARDLTGLDDLAAVVEAMTRLADDILAAAARFGDKKHNLAVIAMGKLGARELNYASDVDVVLVGDGDPRALLGIARAGWKVDLDLRPEGRSGPLTRSLASYVAYWDRWADTWEFQALLKARPVAGNIELGESWLKQASSRLWSRPFGADELREVRDLKRRAEEEIERRGLGERELKLGRGGIRDIEFAVQLLQMVHGRSDPALRIPATLPALGALSAGGYVAPHDADALAEAYRWLRRVEHRVQLSMGVQAHALPKSIAARTHLARVLGFRDTPSRPALAHFDEVLRGHQSTVRALHERLFFRPLLEAFTAAPGLNSGLAPPAIEDRLSAFGFSDASRTQQAVVELTRGFSRASQLWQQMLPLVLGWLSESPDPDLGLLGLRALAANRHARDQMVTMIRESAESTRQLCLLLGTGPVFTRDLLRNPDLLRSGLGLPPSTLEPASSTGTLATRSPGPRRGDSADRDAARAGPGHPPGGLDGTLAERARRGLAWRRGVRQQQDALQAFQRAEELGIATRDVLGGLDADAIGVELTSLAEAILAVALDLIEPEVPLAVIAMGRLGGRELSYASDLDVLLVYDGADPGSVAETAPIARAAESSAQSLLSLINGSTPAMRVYTLDTSLRPEGRQGPVARSLDAYSAYYRRWAHTWERQALLRGRFVAGDIEVGRRFAALAEDFIWGQPFTPENVREIRRTKARVELERIPATEDPKFHLKLGRGSLSDIEWTVQLLQLQNGIAATGTLEALGGLVKGGAIDPVDAGVLEEAYRFCQHARNRLTLVRGVPSNSLPTAGSHLTALARSIGTSPSELREDYRRLTRRSRRVVERLFYNQT